MRVEGISVVKNEQDVIEPFVRHQLRYLDHLTVTDNGSVDQTLGILYNLKGELAERLTVLSEPKFGDSYSERVTGMMRMTQQARRPDFLFSLDADEFLEVEPATDLQQELEAIPAGGLGVMRWRALVLDNSQSDPPRSLTVARRTNQVPKVVIRLRELDAAQVLIHTGSHFAQRLDSTEAMPSRELVGVHLRHCPIRSLDQFLGKTVVGWMAGLQVMPEMRNSGINCHKQANYDMIVRGVVTEFNLSSLSYEFAQGSDPDWPQKVDIVPDIWDYERRYSDGQPMPWMQMVMKAWEQSLLEGRAR